MFRNAIDASGTTALLVVFLSAPVQPAHADAFLDALRANAPSSAALEYGGDAEDSRDVTLDFDVGLPDGNRMQLSATQADVRTESDDYHSDRRRIGLAGDPLAPVDYGLGFEMLERDDKVSTETVDGFARWRPGGWSLALYPQQRTISLRNDVNDLRVAIRNPGLGASIGYSWDSGITLSARRDAYDYSLDADALSRSRLAVRVASTRIAQEFDIERNQLALAYSKDALGVSVTWSRRVSAIDHTESDTLELGANWDVNDAFGLFGRYGRVREDDDSYVDFATGGVIVFWN